MIAEANLVAVQWLLDWYRETRKTTLEICQPLTIEDHVVQSSPDVSPPSWHLGHTTWFFETFILEQFNPDYTPFDSGFSFIFNSYYESAGKRIQKTNRGLLSRPTVQEIHRYRNHVDEEISALLAAAMEGSGVDKGRSAKGILSRGDYSRIQELMELGIHHEKQHQELLLMDIKHNFFCHPLFPEYGMDAPSSLSQPSVAGTGWLTNRKDSTLYHTRTPLLAGPEAEGTGPFETAASLRNGLLFDAGGTVQIGHASHGFGYDNEYPRHPVHQGPFWIASRPVTNGEFLEFMEAGGYSSFQLWLSAGWQWVQENDISHPYYWRKHHGTWQQWTLRGWQDLDLDQPAKHLSYFEAEAMATSVGKRLPTEVEWELAASVAVRQGLDFQWGRVWEWTGSAYRPYPGFKPAPGAIGEYNGKFMMDQMVLRGACDFTPVQHSRLTYRNFYPASSVWQMSGLRLAEDA